MSLDRAIQLDLLRSAAATYPNGFVLEDRTGPEAVNAMYLQEHGLAKCTSADTFDGVLVADIYITAKGLDFLENDGGLTAILNVVEVRLHADTIKDLIKARVASSDLPEDEKSALTRHVDGLPAGVLGHLTNKLVDLGLRSGPDALNAIRTGLGLG